MKKLLILLCAVLLLCGCAEQTAVQPDTAADSEPIATLGSVLGKGAEIYASAYNEDRYVCVFGKDGAMLRAVARLTPEAYQALRDGSESAELLAAMETESVEDLTAAMPRQAELDRLVGKTGGELLDDGWEIVGHTIYNDFMSSTVFYLVKGFYSYTVQFDETVSVDENFSEADAMRPLTIASVTCDGVSEHCVDLNDLEQ